MLGGDIVIDRGDAIEEQEEREQVEESADQRTTDNSDEHINFRQLLPSSQNSKELRKYKYLESMKISTFCSTLIWLLPQERQSKTVVFIKDLSRELNFSLRNVVRNACLNVIMNNIYYQG